MPNESVVIGGCLRQRSSPMRFKWGEELRYIAKCLERKQYKEMALQKAILYVGLSMEIMHD